MIKRSIPNTLSVFCETHEYAEGVKDGIMYTLECLRHECDIILRVSPTVEKITIDEADKDKLQQYKVRARFTAREKRAGKEKGDWIKINRAYYEEEMNDRFDTDREWKNLTHEELVEIIGISTSDSDWNVLRVLNWAKAIEAKLKEKNNG